MAIDKKIKYQDQRLTAAEKKNIKPEGFIVGKNNIYLSLNNGRIVIIEILTGKPKDIIKIDVEEDLKKTYSSFNLLPFTGITLPKDTICNLYFLKNSISLELNLDNKLKDIEKLEEKTI